ncbi:hypothetical protein T440DRAFT_226269 [Plenodomus tracheiphilus IPT5]|uniref:Sodium/calcium exchanger membrane region domain-containing protein n=1 Tax=Plenodomus tracheiphilus IPT5 TaxID=1408161 RepID=A0A6A7AVV2_9PLEO|nr:hypothetical protein T440DRAFT_226269 [Plenodomus tracheiphilus IPT5]
MLGLSFVAGGVHHQESSYFLSLSSILASLLTLSVAGLVLPTACQLLATPVDGGIIKQSRAIAVVFMVIYAGLLYYQLCTHYALFLPAEKYDYGDDEETETKTIKLSTAIILVLVSTVFIGLNTYFAVNSLEGLWNTTGLTTSFVGIVLLPLFTNDLEPLQAAYRGDMDLCLQNTVGKCIQTTLFVIPLVVMNGWGMGIDEMTLQFDGFDITALFASTLYIAFLTNNGSSNWFEGVALLGMYVIISISAYYIE